MQHSFNLEGGKEKKNSQKQKKTHLNHRFYTICHFKQILLSKMHPYLNSHKESGHVNIQEKQITWLFPSLTVIIK